MTYSMQLKKKSDEKVLLAIYLTPVVQISGRICPQMAEGAGRGRGVPTGRCWGPLGDDYPVNEHPADKSNISICQISANNVQCSSTFC